MTNIIWLDQPTATTMNNVRGLVKMYASRNGEGRYDEAVSKYKNLYKSLMKDLTKDMAA